MGCWINLLSEIFAMMTQLFLKPGVLGPVPICLGEILVTAEAAVRLALQQDELPIAYLVLTNTWSCKELFYPRGDTAQGILHQD
jgi:hypothetical protein